MPQSASFEPMIIDQVLDEKEFQELVRYTQTLEFAEANYDKGHGRFMFSDATLHSYTEKILGLSRRIFGSPSCMPTFSVYAKYFGKDARLYPHRDDNACTYTVDICLSHKVPWALWVDCKRYVLHPNQALCYMGNDHIHWRENLPSPETNTVEMLILHFVEPDHWFFTKGPDHVRELRKNTRKTVEVPPANRIGEATQGDPQSSASGQLAQD